jgi:hypothetical protein
MGLVIRAVLAFCIGGAAMYGLQRVWLSNIKQQLAAQRVTIPQVQMKQIPTVEPTKMRAAVYPKLDPKIGQNAWRGTLNQQINQSINASRMVPLPPRHYGIPR